MTFPPHSSPTDEYGTNRADERAWEHESAVITTHLISFSPRPFLVVSFVYCMGGLRCYASAQREYDVDRTELMSGISLAGILDAFHIRKVA